MFKLDHKIFASNSKILLFIDKFLHKKKFPNKEAMKKVISEISLKPKSVYDSLTRNVHIIKTICDSIGSDLVREHITHQI